MVSPLALKRSTSRSLPWSGCARGGEGGKAWLTSGQHQHIPAKSICILLWNNKSTTQKEWPEIRKCVWVCVCLFVLRSWTSYFLVCFVFSRHLQYFSFRSKVYQNNFFPYWASCNIFIWKTETLGKLWQGSDIQKLFELLIPLSWHMKSYVESWRPNMRFTKNMHPFSKLTVSFFSSQLSWYLLQLPNLSLR